MVTTSILVINCGSSSIKFGLYDKSDLKRPLLSAVAEKLGEEQPDIIYQGAINGQVMLPARADHRQAMQVFIDQAEEDLSALAGIGHRVVHGGERFHDSVLLDAETIAALKELNPLAPLHNPINMLGIELCQELFPGVPQAAVFDTSFHQSMDESVYLYGVPYDWYEQDGVRRYGFHGTSYRYITQETARLLDKPVADINLLIAHLGNGCSACAVRGGQSVDTTMGLTPMEGLVMGTRSGDIDPGLIEHMMRSRDLPMADIMKQLNRGAGLKGLSGKSNDMRTLLLAAKAGNDACQRAIDVFCFRVARQFAALSVSLPSVDAVVFTGGIGEHSGVVREKILANWPAMGFRLDDYPNRKNGSSTQGRISVEDTPRVLVVPTDEESMIAQDTLALISAQLS
ncbi:MAG: propionate/acetate kinase [Oceanospirillaceae bacterium]|nr:propionate/acetate kinase [Oceanospirillaceae bacterium]MBT13496.1 propionate/acetate kinase [Oceanospirillaceae bacterium]